MTCRYRLDELRREVAPFVMTYIQIIGQRHGLSGRVLLDRVASEMSNFSRLVDNGMHPVRAGLIVTHELDQELRKGKEQP